MASVSRILLMDAAAIARTLRRMADEILERTAGAPLAVVGIHSRGVVVARRLVDLLAPETDAAFGMLDVGAHRDDLAQRGKSPALLPTQLPADLASRVVILADDVFSTGRTIRAAMDALNHYTRPRRLQLAALIDRRQREFPIRPDYTGREHPTSPSDRVQVRFDSHDREPDSVWVTRA